jgi:hypothetical protein
MNEIKIMMAIVGTTSETNPSEWSATDFALILPNKKIAAQSACVTSVTVGFSLGKL